VGNPDGIFPKSAIHVRTEPPDFYDFCPDNVWDRVIVLKFVWMAQQAPILVILSGPAHQAPKIANVVRTASLGFTNHSDGRRGECNGAVSI
jgi:hypothetical protein